MHTPASMSPSLTVASVAAGAAGAAALARPSQAPRSWRAALAMAALGAAALVGAWAGVAGEASPGSLSQDVQAFQQRVTEGSLAPSVAAPAEVLARRYWDALAPDVRRRIGEQVRAEQQAGRTASGNQAFVMRRLALYEDALQQAATVARAQAGGGDAH